MSENLHRNILATMAVVLLTGCGLMPARETGTTASEPAAEPLPERAAEAHNGSTGDNSDGYSRNVVYLASDDQAIVERRQKLLDDGHESVALDRVGFYMDVLTARLRQELAGRDVDLDRADRAITLTFPGSQAFETNSAEIHPDMAPILGILGRVLDEYDASLITIAGHTDSTGAREFNQHLSEQRALSVGRHLHDQGVAETRIIAIGYGPDRPIADNDTLQGQALNRRVELRIEPLAAT
ncbi:MULTISPECIES: OmpA family protein [unclassified Thioalkalivibrio]|uniref:OmpA family protein n=1 Tax=unclassified Thioalkalivibrio TaxID=2621013 RepID=UPI000374BDA7|nr:MULTISPECIES: OmpA family protein [unclassified Thioalkalivibrio]